MLSQLFLQTRDERLAPKEELPIVLLFLPRGQVAGSEGQEARKWAARVVCRRLLRQGKGVEGQVDGLAA